MAPTTKHNRWFITVVTNSMIESRSVKNRLSYFIRHKCAYGIVTSTLGEINAYIRLSRRKGPKTEKYLADRIEKRGFYISTSESDNVCRERVLSCNIDGTLVQEEGRPETLIGGSRFFTIAIPEVIHPDCKHEIISMLTGKLAELMRETVREDYIESKEDSFGCVMDHKKIKDFIRLDGDSFAKLRRSEKDITRVLESSIYSVTFVHNPAIGLFSGRTEYNNRNNSNSGDDDITRRLHHLPQGPPPPYSCTLTLPQEAPFRPAPFSRPTSWVSMNTRFSSSESDTLPLRGFYNSTSTSTSSSSSLSAPPPTYEETLLCRLNSTDSGTC